MTHPQALVFNLWAIYLLAHTPAQTIIHSNLLILSRLFDATTATSNNAVLWNLSRISNQTQVLHTQFRFQRSLTLQQLKAFADNFWRRANVVFFAAQGGTRLFSSSRAPAGSWSCPHTAQGVGGSYHNQHKAQANSCSAIRTLSCCIPVWALLCAAQAPS